MFHLAYICPWCKKDLKSKEIPFMAKSYYPEEDSHFTNAIELFNNRGFECPECSCRWDFEGKIFKEGKIELKDEYKVEENIEDVNNDKEIMNDNNNNIENQEEYKDG